MNTKVNIKYPIEGTVLFSDTLTIHYNLTNKTDPNVFGIRFIVNNGNEYTDTNLDGTYTITGFTENKQVLTGYLINKNFKKIANTDFDIRFETFDSKLDIENKLSYVLKSTIPDFVKEDYPNFIMFLKAYYEWLYSSNNPFYAPLISENFKDIDKTPEFFVKHFRKQYLSDFPESLTKDKESGNDINIKTLLKNIVDFYSAKGTEKSIKFLLKILYDTYSEVYYPKRDIFKASQSKWNQNNSIKFIFSSDRVHEIKSKRMYQESGETVFSIATINEIQVYRTLDNKQIVEVFYTNVEGEFNFSKEFKVDLLDEIISLTPVVVVNDIIIEDGGLNYKVNDKLVVKRLTVTAGLVEEIAIAKVTEVDKYGTITKTEFVNFGISYIPKQLDSNGNIIEPNIFLYYVTPESELGTDAVFTVGTGFISNYSGYWTNKNSHPDSIKRIADNKRFQEFSYVVRTDRSLDKYAEVLKKLAHPAGIELLGDVLIQKTIVEPAIINDAFIEIYTPLIGNYLAYRLDTNLNIRETTAPVVEIQNEQINNIINISGGFYGQSSGPNLSNPLTHGIVDTSNPNFVKLSTRANYRFSRARLITIDQPYGATTPTYDISTRYRSDFIAKVQVTQYDSNTSQQNVCNVGFFASHNGQDCLTDIRNESFIGFRPSPNGKWAISLYTNSENTPIPTNVTPLCLPYYEYFNYETEYSIYGLNTLRVIISNFDQKARFYINNKFILETVATDLGVPNLGNKNDLGNLIYIGVETRQRQINGTVPVSINSHYMKFSCTPEINTNEIYDIIDLFPNGFDPTQPIPIQDGNKTSAHDAINPLNEFVSETKFKFEPDVSDVQELNNYWVVYPHPNTEINNYNNSTNFLNITIKDFVKQEK